MMDENPGSSESASRIRALSPDASSGNDRKRRRKVLSCYDCRRRKLQCDRAMPACGRCTKAGQAANCLYLEDPSEAPRDVDTTPTAPRSSTNAMTNRSVQQAGSAGDALARLEYQDARIRELESALARSGGHDAVPRIRSVRGSPIDEINVNGTSHDRDSVLLRGKSFKTKFHGCTHPCALMTHIPELHGFTRDAFEKYTVLRRIREDLHSLARRSGYEGIRHEITTSNDLKAFLPSKEETDHSVKTYLDNYGSIYHVFHLPTFWRDYTNMWANISEAKPHFIALVLVIVAAEQCLNTSKQWLYTANSSTARDRAITMIQAVDDWLLQQSQKQVTATDFQIRVLLQLAKRVSARKFKRTWTESGCLTRFCMGAGLHRDPDLIRKTTSVLDKELRRRVWAAVTELELQASFDRGMLATQWTLQSDCPPPSNIDDEDIDQSTELLPPQRRTTDAANVTYLAIAGESILLRCTLNTYLNNIRQIISFDEVKKYTEEIEAQLQALPELTGANSAIPQALLRLNLWQYMLVLHDRHFRSAETRFERDFSRMIIVETAANIIDTHKSLTSKGCYALELLLTDQLRAALSICHVAITMDPRADDAISKACITTGDRLLADAIDMIDDKVVRFGCEQRQLWLVLAAQGLMQARRDPEGKEMYMQQAVDRITRPYYKIMACQDDAPTQVSSNGPPTARETPNMATSDYYPKPDGGLQSMASDPILLDIDEIAAWTFDDFTFNPMDLGPFPPA